MGEDGLGHQDLMLHSLQWEKDEKSIYQAKPSSDDDKEQIGQMVAPVNIPLLMCCQTVENNPKVKQTGCKQLRSMTWLG